MGVSGAAGLGKTARTHELELLARDLGETLPEELLALQVFAVEARYEEGPFCLLLSRSELLFALEERLAGLERQIGPQLSDRP
jgi:hypothetical protein